MENISLEEIANTSCTSRSDHFFILKAVEQCENFKLCLFELNFGNYMIEYPEENYIYTDEINIKKTYYDQIKKERKIKFYHDSRLVDQFIDINANLVKTYSKKVFREFSGSSE